MAASSRFAQISYEEINGMKENAVPISTKTATKYVLKLFKSRISLSKIILKTIRNLSLGDYRQDAR